jgi:hypothetical protein
MKSKITGTYAKATKGQVANCTATNGVLDSEFDLTFIITQPPKFDSLTATYSSSYVPDPTHQSGFEGDYIYLEAIVKDEFGDKVELEDLEWYNNEHGTSGRDKTCNDEIVRFGDLLMVTLSCNIGDRKITVYYKSNYGRGEETIDLSVLKLPVSSGSWNARIYPELSTEFTLGTAKCFEIYAYFEDQMSKEVTLEISGLQSNTFGDNIEQVASCGGSSHFDSPYSKYYDITLNSKSDERKIIVSIAGTNNKAIIDEITVSTTRGLKRAPTSLLSTPAENNLNFTITDVTSSNTHYKGINYLYHHSITKGCSWNKEGNKVTTAYCPTRTVNRGSMAELMYNLMGKPKITKTIPDINDISTLSTARQKAIKWLASEKITVITKDKKFNPNSTVNRGAMAEFLYKLVGSPVYTPTTQELARFTDISNLSDARQKAIAWLAKHNITTGNTKTTYAPNKAVTRGSMATFFMRLVNEFGS